MTSDFKSLVVWQKAIDFTKRVYQLTSKFPKEEAYCLTSQIRRAVVSISSNIAEGCGRSSNPDLIRFLYYVFGSCKEVENQLVISFELKYINYEQYEKTNQECCMIGRKINRLIRYLNEQTKRLKNKNR